MPTSLQRLVFGVMIVASVVVLWAQVAFPSFEVASVKPNMSGSGQSRFALQAGQRLVGTNVPLLDIIMTAYQIDQDLRLVTIPDWVRRSRFNIDAKAPDAVTLGRLDATGPPSPIVLMLRGLLGERFALRTHFETQQLPVFHLLPARSDRKLGAALKPSTVDCEALAAARAVRGEPDPPRVVPAVGDVAPCRMLQFRDAISTGRLVGRAVGGSQPLSELIRMLSRQMKRIVVDRTQLTGNFDFALTWAPDDVTTADPNYPSLAVALQEQLGLKLESTRGPVEVLVIDSVSQPTPD